MSERKREIVEEAVASLKEAGEKAPEIKGIPTGVEGLDELFFTAKITAKGPKKVPLGGFPQYAVVNLTGISDTGKSLIVEQFALTQANNTNTEPIPNKNQLNLIFLITDLRKIQIL